MLLTEITKPKFKNDDLIASSLDSTCLLDSNTFFFSLQHHTYCMFGTILASL